MSETEDPKLRDQPSVDNLPSLTAVALSAFSLALWPSIEISLNLAAKNNEWPIKNVNHFIYSEAGSPSCIIYCTGHQMSPRARGLLIQIVWVKFCHKFETQPIQQNCAKRSVCCQQQWWYMYSSNLRMNADNLHNINSNRQLQTKIIFTPYVGEYRRFLLFPSICLTIEIVASVIGFALLSSTQFDLQVL